MQTKNHGNTIQILLLNLMVTAMTGNTGTCTWWQHHIQPSTTQTHSSSYAKLWEIMTQQPNLDKLC
jgi:hypothetical protein